MDEILHYIACNGLKDLIRHKANFDWHRELIVELRKRLPLGRLGARTLFSFKYCFTKCISQASDCQVAPRLVMPCAGLMTAAMLCRHWDISP
jgi:hypothetical protein